MADHEAADEPLPLSRQQQYGRMHTTLAEDWRISQQLASAAGAAWRTAEIARASPALHSPAESLFSPLPLDLSLHALSFLQDEAALITEPSAAAVCRHWAGSLSKLTMDAAQQDAQGGSLSSLRTVADHIELMLSAMQQQQQHGAASRVSQHGRWLRCMRAAMERITLQLIITASPNSLCTTAQRHQLFVWLARIALTLPSIDSALAARILLRSITLADEITPATALASSSPALHHLSSLLLVANATLFEASEPTLLALTSSQASALLDHAHSTEQVRTAADEFRQRVMRRVEEGSTAALEPSAVAAATTSVHSPAAMACAVWCIAADVLARLEPSLLDADSTEAAVAAAAAAPVELPCAFWFAPSPPADSASADSPLQAIRIENLCCNVEAQPEWQIAASSAAAPSAPAAAAVVDRSIHCHWPPLLQHLWCVTPSNSVLRTVVDCCLSSPALLSSSILPVASFSAPFMKSMPAAVRRLQQTTWRQALRAYTNANEPAP